MTFGIKEFVIFGTLLLIIISLSVIFFVVFYQRKQLLNEISIQEEKRNLELELQKKLLNNTLDVQEAERQRLAKDLHDEVGAILSVLKMNNGQLFNNSLRTEKSIDLISNNKNLIDEAIQMVRNVSKDLVPQTLESFGLVVAIEEFFNKLDKNTNIEIEFINVSFPTDKRLKKSIELSLFRIIQELSNNSLKHSNASKISLILMSTYNNINLEYKDDGIGFDFEKKSNMPNGGLGLGNIESRLSALDGKFEIKSEEGTKVIIEIENIIWNE